MFKMFKKDKTDQFEVTISNQTVLRVLALVVGVVLLVTIVRQASHSLLLIFTAFFLALALNAPVQGIARRLPGRMSGNRSVATSISFAVVVLLIAGFLVSIVPPLVKQTEGFISSAPQLVRDAHNQDSEFGSLIRKYHLEGQLDSFSKDFGSRLKNISGSALSTVGKVGTSIFSTLTILVLTFMMLIEGPKVMEFFRELVPPRKRKDVERLSNDMYRVIKGYVNGQVTLAALASVLILPALFALHISYPIALMVVVFICGLIPMVGHTIGAIIVTLVALATSPVSAIIILGYYILYQQIENYIVQPRIQANSTNMSPLLVFLSVVVGVRFGGLVGGLFAIPVAGCLRILVLDYLVSHKYINDETAPVIQDAARSAKADV